MQKNKKTNIHKIKTLNLLNNKSQLFLQQIIKYYTYRRYLTEWETIQLVYVKKPWPIWYSKLLYKMGQDFLDIQ